MNLNPTAVFAMLGGVVLLYSAVKNMYPQDVLRTAMGKEPIHGPIVTASDDSGAEGDGDVIAPGTLGPNPNAGTPTVEV